MIVLKQNTVNTFRIAYKSTFTEVVSVDDVVLKLERVSAEDITYIIGGISVDYDCYNRIIEIQTSNLMLETGEYTVSLWLPEGYSSEYSLDYEHSKYFAVDNANVIRQYDMQEDTSGVAYRE